MGRHEAVRPRRRGRLRASPAHGRKRVILNVVAFALLAGGVPTWFSGCSMQERGHDVWSDHVTGGRVGFSPGGQHDAWDEMTDLTRGGGRRIMIGMFATVIGAAFLLFANAGSVARYQAGEFGPVANDVAQDVAPAIRTVVGSVVEGLRSSGAGPGGQRSERVPHECGAMNDPDDGFCKGCGKALASPVCRSCGAENDHDAHFCDACGKPLAT